MRTASGVAKAAEHARTTGQVLPVSSELVGVVPGGGLRRGSTVAVRGATSLLLALLAEATAGGAWAAVIGMPELGVVAASELGVEVSRLALVPRPGARFAEVTAALLDGLDLVVLSPSGKASDQQTARRLSARARHRGAVLLVAGPWPGADVELRCVPSEWSGLDAGYGHFRARTVTVSATGRGAAARPRRTELYLPGHGGAAEIPGAPDELAPRRDQWLTEEVG